MAAGLLLLTESRLSVCRRCCSRNHSAAFAVDPSWTRTRGPPSSWIRRSLCGCARSDLDGRTRAVRSRIRDNVNRRPSVSRELQSSIGLWFVDSFHRDSVVIRSGATRMGFGWAERRVVRGPQGPPCSFASVTNYLRRPILYCVE